MQKLNEKQKSIVSDFQASDKNIVLDAIKRNRADGNAQTFSALIQTLVDTDEPDVEAGIIQFLFDLKDQESVPVLIEALGKKETSYYHSFLVAAFWQSAIDGSDYLDFFVRLAIQGDYMVCLEALTVVENFDAAYPESELLDLETDLTEALEKEQDADKKSLLQSLGDVVRNLPIEGE